jgi:Ca-activated chloride channel family protein
VIAGTAAVLGAALTASPAADTQDQVQPGRPPQFRTGTEMVPVYATVRDDQGVFILDLKKEDFELRDNGQVQEITQFTTDVQPLSVVLMLDGSGSMMNDFDRVIEGASAFIVRMLPQDRARIGSFSDGVNLMSSFTSDRDVLLKYLADQFNLRVGLQTHLWEAIVKGSVALNRETGKRVVLVLSDGYNFHTETPRPTTNPTDPFGGQPPRGMPRSSPRGPTGGTSVPIVGGPMPVQTGTVAAQAEDAALDNNTMVYAVSMWVVQDNERKKPSRDLERVALETGGSFFRLDEYADISPAFTQISNELRQQYLLGFTPKKADGKSHKLEVRVKRSGLRVQHRRSYMASGPQ